MKRKVTAFVFARGGSKGLPRKNLHLLDGRPLIAHSIVVARSCPSIDRIIVSTDDEEIAETARQWGGETPFLRPAELAHDSSNEWLAWRHAIEYLTEVGQCPDIFVSLPATSPLRSVEDVENCIAALDEDVDVVVTATPARNNPWYSMIMRDEKGLSRRVIDSDLTRRQDAPEVFDMTGVAYVTRPAFIRHSSGVYDGRVKSVVIPAERAVDIDDNFDFLVAETCCRHSHG